MEQKQWYQKQLRMLQTVLREPDIVGYDARAVVEYMEKTRTNCIIVNAGGIVDFFDSKVELANKNPFLTTEDMLGDLVREAHAKGIRVMVRVDFRGVDRQRYEKMPHWFAAGPDGGPKLNPQGLCSPCYSSEYANGHAVRYIRHVMETFGVDGVWENSLGFGGGPCYCKTCRDLYRRDTGREIPVGADYTSEVFADYRRWKAGRADAHIRLLRDAVKSYGPDKAYCAEIFGMFHAGGAISTGIDLYNARHFDFLVSPAFPDVGQPNRVYDTLSYAASSIRFMKSLDKSRQAVLLSGNNGTRWRYVIAPSVETRIWLWEAASVGAGYWNCLFNGQHPAATFDTRNAYIEKDVYSYLADNEEILTDQAPVEDVGIFFSKATRDALGKDDENIDGYGVFIKGVESVLVDAHIQYSFIPDIDFSLEKIKHLKLLILPNGALMSDGQIETVRQYVAQGGGLVASYETSLYDENGVRRADFGLKDLFGVSYTGVSKDTSSDCYQRVADAAHPILGGMGIERTSLIINGGSTLLCTPLEQAGYTSVCRYVPLIFNQPPEKAWIKDMETQFPTITAGAYGAGRVVYFANQTDKLCHTNGHEDFVNTFGNAVRWAMAGEPSLRTDAPDSVHVALTRQAGNPGRYVLSFVNMTAAPRRPIKQLLPVGGFSADVRLPGRALGEARVLKQDGPVKVGGAAEGGAVAVHVEVSSLKEFASVTFEVV